MPTEGPRSLPQQRVLRYAAGTALALAFSQALNWEQAFLAVVFATTFLGLPIPAPRLRGGINLMLALIAAMALGMFLILPVQAQPLAGIGLLALLFFAVFYSGLRGGNPLVGALLSIGLAVIPVVGAFDIRAAISVVNSLLKGGVVGVAALWAAHALFPDPALPTGPGAQRPPLPDAVAAGRLALRSTLVVMPVILWLLATANLGSLVVAIKVASMGQQACTDTTRKAGIGLLASTAIGGLAAIGVWVLLKASPTLPMYVLLVGLTGLILGRRTFAGPALAPSGPIFSYGMVTMLIILGPAVLDSGDAAGTRFFDRIFRLGVATAYAVFSVTLFDALIEWRVRRGSARVRARLAASA
jgi:hypothetical protein